jgi:hypothetical protein
MIRSQRMLLVLLAISAAASCPSCAPVDSQRAETETPPQSRPESTAAVPATRPPEQGKDRIERAIEQVRRRDLLTSNGFWTVFHGILGLGPSTTLLNPETGVRVNALDYICRGGELRGLQFIPTKHGLDVQMGPLFVGQGHQDQFVAEMAQWGIPLDRKFVVHGREYAFRDFVEHTKMRARVNAHQELSWAILVIGQYHGVDYSWTNGSDEKLHLEDLVRAELQIDMDRAPCGGTHHLFGLTWVYYLRLRQGGQTEGVWKEVAERLKRYQQAARSCQNGDGSFSTNFFRPRGDARDPQLRMNSTGHILEWLSLWLSDRELKEPWVQDAANALALMFEEIHDAPMDGGSLYHAAHGLLLYHARTSYNSPYRHALPAFLQQ